MLLKITESCSMGCTHCMNDSKPNGEDISLDILEGALNFLVKNNIYHNIILSGGEPTEHKNFVEVAERVIYRLKGERGFKTVTIATNGFWVVQNQEEAKRLVALSDLYTKVVFQVSTDSRFYPKKLDTTKRIWREDGFLLCKDCVKWVYPQGRAKENGYDTPYKSSQCFNIRAVAKQLEEKDLCSVVRQLESLGRICTPSIRVDGSIGLGESDLCPNCANIYMNGEEIVQSIINFKCKGCYPLNENLPEIYKRFVE